MPPERRQLVIDLDRADALRAQFGAIGWRVLEALAARARPGGGVVEVDASTRTIGSAIGLSKDTVARGLRCLAAAGVVERVDRRDDVTGRFTSTTYLVDLAAAGMIVHGVPGPTPSAKGANPGASRNEIEIQGHQLRLLD